MKPDSSETPRPPEPSSAAPEPVPGADRRARSDRRAGEDRRKRSVLVPVERRTGGDRRSVADRRAVDAGKTAGGYDLDADTLEFIHAVNRFKAESGKPFPTWSEVMSIVRALGYEKRRH